MNKRNVISLGTFCCLYVICDALIKTYGGVFVYKKSQSVFFVLLFIFLYSFFQLIFNLLFKKLHSKKPKLSLILLVIPFLSMYSIFFINIHYIWFTIIISISNAFINSFYFCPINNLIGKLKCSGSISALSKIQILEQIGKIAVPVISGMLLDYFSSSFVAFIGIIIYICSTLIIIFGYKEMPQDDISTEQISTNTPKPKIKINFKKYQPWLFEALYGVITALDIIWAVYVYINFQNFTMVGLMGSVWGICAFISNVFIALYLKNKKTKAFALVGYMGVISLWFARPLLLSSVFFIAFTCIKGFCDPLFLNAMNSVYFKYYNGKDKSDKYVLKDVYRKSFTAPLALLGLLIPNLLFMHYLYLGVLSLGIFQVNLALKNNKKIDLNISTKIKDENDS